MTILHWAMENGLDTAKAIIEALDIRHDPERNDKYLYMDRDGIEYSPQQYVMKLLGADEKEKKALITSLEGATLKSRYFKRIFPNEGDQPSGYHGLPPSYAKAWEVHEKSPLRADAAYQEEFIRGIAEILGARVNTPTMPGGWP